MGEKVWCPPPSPCCVVHWRRCSDWLLLSLVNKFESLCWTRLFHKAGPADKDIQVFWGRGFGGRSEVGLLDRWVLGYPPNVMKRFGNPLHRMYFKLVICTGFTVTVEQIKPVINYYNHSVKVLQINLSLGERTLLNLCGFCVCPLINF